MNRRTLLTGVASAAGGALVLKTSTALAAKGGGGGELAAVVTGTRTNPATGVVERLAGTLTISNFAVVGNTVNAVGTVVARVTTLAGGATGTVTQAVSIPVDLLASNATCEVLTLVLGPLRLELLGLVIDLNRVVLTITADPSGGLLGQLLCALAGNTLLSSIANILNRLLALFGSV